MADNFDISTADGNRTIATDLIESVDYQRAKLIHGVDGTNDGDTARTNPLPVQAYLESSTMHDGETQVPPKFKTVTLTADGAIVAAVTSPSSKKIRVLAMTISCDTIAEDVNIEDGSGGTTLWTCENIPLGVMVLPFNPAGWFETSASTALYADITAPGTNTHIAVVYVEVD